jgi:hypothetical protein
MVIMGLPFQEVLILEGIELLAAVADQVARELQIFGVFEARKAHVVFRGALDVGAGGLCGRDFCSDSLEPLALKGTLPPGDERCELVIEALIEFALGWGEDLSGLSWREPRVVASMVRDAQRLHEYKFADRATDEAKHVLVLLIEQADAVAFGADPNRPQPTFLVDALRRCVEEQSGYPASSLVRPCPTSATAIALKRR